MPMAREFKITGKTVVKIVSFLSTESLVWKKGRTSELQFRINGGNIETLVMKCSKQLTRES